MDASAAAGGHCDTAAFAEGRPSRFRRAPKPQCRRRAEVTRRPAQARESTRISAKLRSSQLGAQFESLSRGPRKQPCSIAVDHTPRLVVPMPARQFVPLRLGNTRLPQPAVERLQGVARMIPPVGDHVGARLGRGSRIDRGEMLCRAGPAFPALSRCHPDPRNATQPQHGTGVEVHRRFRLVGKVHPAILSLAILASGSLGLSQSALDSFLPLRWRSSRTSSSAVCVSIPLSWPSASASRDRLHRCHAVRSSAARHWPPSSMRRHRSACL
jgi:hypothetical protein